MHTLRIFFGVAHALLSSEAHVHVLDNEPRIIALRVNRRLHFVAHVNTILNIFLVLQGRIWHTVDFN